MFHHNIDGFLSGRTDHDISTHQSSVVDAPGSEPIEEERSMECSPTCGSVQVAYVLPGNICVMMCYCRRMMYKLQQKE